MNPAWTLRTGRLLLTPVSGADLRGQLDAAAKDKAPKAARVSTTDADARFLFWFVNETLVGRSAADAVTILNADPGGYKP